MRKLAIIVVLGACVVGACGKKQESAPSPVATEAAPDPTPPPASSPPLDKDNIVSIALASKDHTTLVAALKAANYVTSVSASGPLTVFAPTNAAFEKLPKATLDDLLKPENQAKLQDVLKYHVTTSVHLATDFKDGDVLAMANGAKATIHINGDKITINDATIVASIRASNGVVHVIDTVLVPPAK